MLTQPTSNDDSNQKMLWQDCIYFYLKSICSTPQEATRRKAVIKNLKSNGFEIEDLRVYVGRFVQFAQNDDFLLMGLNITLKNLVRTAEPLEVTDEEWLKSLGVSYHYNLNIRSEGAFYWRGNAFAIDLIESFRQWATGNCNTMPCEWCDAPMKVPDAGTANNRIYCTETCRVRKSENDRKRNDEKHKTRQEKSSS